MTTANNGRTPRPAPLKLLNGRGRGRDSGGRIVEDSPNFPRLPPEPPDGLGEYAAAEWRRVVPELARLKLLKPIDRAGLTCYCELWETFVEATKDVHSRGIVVENTSVKHDGTQKTWYTANPAVQVQKAAQAAIRAWCSEFGLTPAAENKVAGAAKQDADEDDPFDVPARMG